MLRRQQRDETGAKFAERVTHTEIAEGPGRACESADNSRTSDTGFAPLAVAATRLRQRGRPATGESRWARRRHRLARAERGN